MKEAEIKEEPRTAPPYPKPIFRITNEETRPVEGKSEGQANFRESKWTREEHQAFVEGLKEHGRQWTLIHRMLPSKSSAQIRTHSQNFFVKVERVANGMDALEYVKSRPTDVFMLPPFGYSQRKDGKRRRRRACKTFSGNFARNLERRIREKEFAKSEVPAESSLTHVLAGEVRLLRSKIRPKADNSEGKKLKGKERHRHKSDSEIDDDDDMLNSSERHSKHRRKHHRDSREEEKVPMMTAYPPQVYPRIDPYTRDHMGIQNDFSLLLNDTWRLMRKLETQYPELNELQKTDADLGNYWHALHECAVSLQHIVNDVSYIHLNSYVVPMPAYPPGQYYPPMARPYFPEHTAGQAKPF